MAQKDDLEKHNDYQRSYYGHRSPGQNHRVMPRDLNASPYIANHLARLKAWARLEPGQRIIDIGCGMGKYTIPLARQGFTMEGLDLSPVLLEQLHEHAGPDLAIPTHCADILQLPTALHGQYDTVMGAFMLHHLPDLDQAFAGISQLLGDRGRAVFLDVNPFCPLYYLQITLSPGMRWAAEKGLLALTPANLRHTLTRAGFHRIAIQKFGIAPPFIRNSAVGPAIDAWFESLRWLEPFAAFQLVYAEKS